MFIEVKKKRYYSKEGYHFVASLYTRRVFGRRLYTHSADTLEDAIAGVKHHYKEHGNAKEFYY